MLLCMRKYLLDLQIFGENSLMQVHSRLKAICWQYLLVNISIEVYGVRVIYACLLKISQKIHHCNSIDIYHILI